MNWRCFKRIHPFGFLLLFFTGLIYAQEPGPLKAYVYEDDPTYAYRVVGQLPGNGFDAYFLNMDSQTWRSEDEVTPTLWNHWVALIVPHQLTSNTANLIVTGGSSTASPPSPEDLALFVPLATATGSIQVILPQVPAQPLLFAELGESIVEDELIAFTWRKTMETGDPTWSAYLPMTKAAVRAMDTAQDYIAGSLGFDIEHFIVTGFSKRGAIAWLTAAIDPRVSAVVPGAFNVPHFAEQLEHHYNSYGFYSEAVADYEKNGIIGNVRSPEGKLLRMLVDPISYKQALTMPHLILNATGDEFFLPDASEAYIHEIPAETLQRIVPNTNHGFEGKVEELIMGMIAWYQVQLYGVPRPDIDWHLEKSGELVVSSDQTPVVVKLWQAANPGARDFRHLIVGGNAWSDTVIAAGSDGRYRVNIPPPVEGYTAYLVELTYPGMAGIPQVYTTSAFVTPDDEPFEVEDPLGDPRSPRYWRFQVNRALAGQPRDYTREALQAMLPIRVLGAYLTSVEALDAYLDRRGPKRNCTAARLNVQAEELGWYTTLYVLGDENIKYWQPYALAERLYAKGYPWPAAGICRLLTRL
ncbi:MAG: PhoPQ-activated pathogenicity-related family protein [Candidatus Thiodiazotropha sp. (ex Epidulcina cf. delphinae)]|nr:PhoPQ-activated pathogenicity-related family protein [Candidatus Thiodiazotropha sp. (ex Epidulcina cf. delphinae)]